MVHVSTGNRIDVVYDYEGNKKVLRGIQPWGCTLIPVPDPLALADVLLTVAAECGLISAPAIKTKAVTRKSYPKVKSKK